MSDPFYKDTAIGFVPPQERLSSKNEEALRALKKEGINEWDTRARARIIEIIRKSKTVDAQQMKEQVTARIQALRSEKRRGEGSENSVQAPSVLTARERLFGPIRENVMKLPSIIETGRLRIKERMRQMSQVGNFFHDEEKKRKMLTIVDTMAACLPGVKHAKPTSPIPVRASV